MNDPINSIQWVDVDTLRANHYNPNVVMNQELTLLERSILKTGWVQPILANRSGTIIDGFHRWSLSRISERLRARYGGKVPVAYLDVTDDKAMILTIRMNRAKGTHIAVKMSAIVRELIDVHKLERDEIAGEIGATQDEVDLLYQEDVFKQRDIQNWQYSKAWVPVEDSK